MQVEGKCALSGKMKVLLTNDDGVGAAGLGALEAACRGAGHEVWVVAPAVEQSMCGHRITTHGEISVTKLGGQRFSVGGTPADCVRMGLFGLGLKPDAVFSGVNHGGNLGQDIHISGTCAAAREAAYHGVPAVAFSHYLVRELAVDWDRVSGWIEALLPGLADEASRLRGAFVNVNFPHLPPGAADCPEVKRTKAARSPLPVAFECRADALDARRSYFHYAARYADRAQDEGSDVQVVFGGRVSVCQVGIHL